MTRHHTFEKIHTYWTTWLNKTSPKNDEYYSFLNKNQNFQTGIYRPSYLKFPVNRQRTNGDCYVGRFEPM